MLGQADPRAGTTARATRSPRAPDRGPRVGLLASIIVPTRNEASNVPVLVARLASALPRGSFEIVFVDDSDDGTELIIGALAENGPVPIQLLHRTGHDRADGLGGAVVEGLAMARANWAC